MPARRDPIGQSAQEVLRSWLKHEAAMKREVRRLAAFLRNPDFPYFYREDVVRWIQPLVMALVTNLDFTGGDHEFQDIQNWTLEDMEEWLTDALNAVRLARTDVKNRERIAALRVTTGRTPEEAKAFRKKADELERRLHEQYDKVG